MFGTFRQIEVDRDGLVLIGTMEGMKEKGFAAYDAILERLDKALDPIMEQRERLNLVLVSDHGECIGDHGKRFHTKYLYKELVQVPLVIRIPGMEAYGVDLPVSLTNMAPTLLSMVGAAVTDFDTQRNLLGLAGVEDPGDGPPIAMFDRVHWGVVQGPWRLIYTPKSHAKQLYNVVSDPDEKVNLADEYPDRAEALLQMIKAIRLAAERHRQADIVEARKEAQKKKVKVGSRKRPKPKKQSVVSPEPAKSSTPPRPTIAP